ncbi:hypothetical protein BJP25_19805 [Actinokineospora bangkokensis]|uniref:EamA domain-containing protein n=1 Tax=Actinokineospora bangkokensis TaxID=1193682 RepID=A0A1Q9LKY2_9PSEU|nr:hypothetical protein BJP25_19805 [Actinokineospora bangkokensis]
MALMLGSGLSNQVGAAAGALAFPVLGPVGVVAVRQWIAAAVLLAVSRPGLRTLTAPQWRLVVGLAVASGSMNLTLYSAVQRIGLGLAVTLEFLGPLAVALLGSRRRVDVGFALVAGAAVVVLVRPTPTTDYLGVALGLAAAACWAAYILLNRAIGADIARAEAPRSWGRVARGMRCSAAATLLSASVYLPVGVVVLRQHPPTPQALVGAVVAGLLASAVPLLADLLALRRVPAHSFGVFMSVNPVLAALVGAVVLGQHLDGVSWAAIGVVVAANVGAVSYRPGSGPGRTSGDLT